MRNTDAGEQTARDITATTGNADVDVRHLDLADRASIAAFADAWSGPLHVLVNNAGVMASPEAHTPEGWEQQFATNHLGHLALALGLHDALAAAGNARIVALSSTAHRLSPVVFEDIHFERRAYEPWLAYGQSKTANVLFAVEATRRWAADGITANSLMPGAIRTNLQRYVENDQATLERWAEAERSGNFFWKTHRAGRGDVGAARDLAAARGHRRALLRGLQRGRRRRQRPAPARRALLRARSRGRRAPLGRLAEHARDARRRRALTRAPVRRIDNGSDLDVDENRRAGVAILPGAAPARRLSQIQTASASAGAASGAVRTPRRNWPV